MNPLLIPLIFAVAIAVIFYVKYKREMALRKFAEIDRDGLLMDNGWHQDYRQEITRKPYDTRIVDLHDGSSVLAIMGPGLVHRPGAGGGPAVFHPRMHAPDIENVRDLMNHAYREGRHFENPSYTGTYYG